MFKQLITTALVVLLAGCGQQETHTFTFTAIPDQDATRLQERFSKVADYLSDTLGVPVKYIPVTSYPAAVTAFRNNEVQLAWFGGLTGVQARLMVPDSQAIAQGYEDQLFSSYFIANTSAGLEPTEAFPTDIEGKSFTFGSKGSTSGRLMPEFFIREQFGQAPEQVFSRVGFSGDHSTTIALVESGAYDVGAVNYQVWDQELASGDIDTSKVKVIWQTPTYLDYHWVIRGDVNQAFGEDFIAQVQQALLDIKDPDLLSAFPRKSFIAAKNSDYHPIQATAEAIGLLDPETP